ncbi:hypothetical protein [Bacillus velezensis]|uniref:hypothetical protein n=1 Tax=Bacillus velezensis TaxID=492670 RepID=UPI0003A72C63|nr:hypothetical protein [Bacillus velezensis]AUS14806.1 hypothetical protein C0W57_00680 [Bacillus velezensis]MCV4329285.1 hypothetical protein [Bacillus velezensis]URD65195.1 hypothetical protein M8X21_04570 [Bacillus velezensis]WED89404.1 hypothetical protein PXG99_10065 [Bacillus velezensis]WFB52419.1 hypothetical protein P0M29_17595 [Bacillus velezensis]
MTTYETKPVAKWKTPDFIGYLHAKHKETYGIPYVTNNRGMEAKNLKRMIDEQGAEVTRRFIDKCFAEKKPTLKYPGCNFAFMFSYMRESVLSRVLTEVQAEQKRADRNEGVGDAWF